MTFTSYAQNFEDVYIWRAFKDDTPFGFYIDVGAYDPIEDSVTQFLYDRGWSGINVEPGPSIARFITRTRDLNLSLAVTAETGFSDFYLHAGDPGTSTTMADLAPELQGRVGDRIESRVATVTLQQLFERYAAGRHVHVLKLDIEGAEREVIAHTDWSVHRPELILVEVTRPYTNERRDDEMLRPLLAARYEEVFFDGVNAYLLREESTFRRGAFNRPVNVLDKFQKRDHRYEALADRLLEAEKEQAAVLARLEAAAQQAETTRIAQLRAMEADLSLERERAAKAENTVDHLRVLSSQQSQEIERLHAVLSQVQSHSAEQTARLENELRAEHAAFVAAEKELVGAKGSAVLREREVAELSAQVSSLLEERKGLGQRVELLEQALDHARECRDRVIETTQALCQERAARETEGLLNRISAMVEERTNLMQEIARLESMVDEVRESRDRVIEATQRLAHQDAARLASQLSQAEEALSALQAWRERLVFELKAPDGPRALSFVLPVARLLRFGYRRGRATAV